MLTNSLEQDFLRIRRSVFGLVRILRLDQPGTKPKKEPIIFVGLAVVLKGRVRV